MKTWKVVLISVAGSVVFIVMLLNFFLSINPDAKMGRTTTAVYIPENGELVLDSDYTITKHERATHDKMWNRVIDIFPDEVEKRIAVVKMFHDGTDETLAAVYPIGFDNYAYELYLDPSDSIDNNGNYVEYFDETIIHELFHVISLNDTQIDSSYDYRSYAYVSPQGTMKSDSYLNIFYQQFWDDIYDERQRTRNVYSFYLNYEDQFVSDYAATSPEEDIAESFAYYVLNDIPQDGSIKSQKVIFFENYPELVQMREGIRDYIGLD